MDVIDWVKMKKEFEDLKKSVSDDMNDIKELLTKILDELKKEKSE